MNSENTLTAPRSAFETRSIMPRGNGKFSNPIPSRKESGDCGRQEDPMTRTWLEQQRERLELPKARLALVIDQLEELFTTGFSPEVRQQYIAVLAGLVRSGRVFALVTLRSDFYPGYQEFPDMIELAKPSGKFDLRPPTPYELGNMIQQPACTSNRSRKRVNAWIKRCVMPPLPHRNPCRCSSTFCRCSTTNRPSGVMTCSGGGIIAN
jgi:hypothetical protein